MKLTDIFADFLTTSVNLNPNRIELLEDSIEALKSFVRDTQWKPHIRSFDEQGSWAHETIIKPVDQGEFDADLLMLVEHEHGWSASDYVEKLGAEFKKSTLYADKVTVWDYCVTITYAGERKVDIAPCVVGRLAPERLEVCNRSTGAFERTEPTEFTRWLKEKNSYSGSNSFRKVTRLLKYLRDIKGTFTCPSVLLTTLIGAQIEWFDKNSDEFSDVPTTLQTIVGRLDRWLQVNSSKPRVENPALRSEDFASSWTEDQYQNFRSFVHKYRNWIDEAIELETRVESIKAWRRVFGEDFAKGVEISAVANLNEGVSKARQFLLSTAAHLDGLVDIIRSYGIAVLPTNFNRPPHLQEPQWPRTSTVSSNVSVFATYHQQRDGSQSRLVKAGDILPARGGLWFDLRINGDQSLPVGYQTQWRITNTGAVAIARKAGRGGFYVPTSGNRRWEVLEYRGVHMAEAFIIRTSDNTLVAQSTPFYVVIE